MQKEDGAMKEGGKAWIGSAKWVKGGARVVCVCVSMHNIGEKRRVKFLKFYMSAMQPKGGKIENNKKKIHRKFMEKWSRRLATIIIR